MLSGLVYAILVGLIAGWLAGKVMKGGGYGVLMDIILGIAGGRVRAIRLRSAGNLGVESSRLDSHVIRRRDPLDLDHASIEKGLVANPSIDLPQLRAAQFDAATALEARYHCAVGARRY